MTDEFGDGGFGMTEGDDADVETVSSRRTCSGDFSSIPVSFVNHDIILFGQFWDDRKIEWDANWIRFLSSTLNRLVGTDLRRQFERVCKSAGVGYPFGLTHLNVKTLFAVSMGLVHEVGLDGAYQRLGMTIPGTSPPSCADCSRVLGMFHLDTPQSSVRLQQKPMAEPNRRSDVLRQPIALIAEIGLRHFELRREKAEQVQRGVSDIFVDWGLSQTTWCDFLLV